MTLSDELAQISTLFIDTAPIIYYIEAHPYFGPLVKVVVDAFQSGSILAFSSVITLAEVLPKPIQKGHEELAGLCSKTPKNRGLLEQTRDFRSKNA